MTAAPAIFAAIGPSLNVRKEWLNVIIYVVVHTSRAYLPLPCFFFRERSPASLERAYLERAYLESVISSSDSVLHQPG